MGRGPIPSSLRLIVVVGQNGRGRRITELRAERLLSHLVLVPCCESIRLSKPEMLVIRWLEF